MYYVSLKQFEGPLDLLLHLITRAKVDIKDIFVSEITEQYLASMGSVDELDMDTASEFLTMAATLLEIKSRALLPRPPVPPRVNLAITLNTSLRLPEMNSSRAALSPAWTSGNSSRIRSFLSTGSEDVSTPHISTL